MRRNVVLIVLDTVRKDFFHEYASRLLKRSDCIFQQCRAASSWSTPSHASMLTGELLHQHGVHANQQNFNDVDVSDTFLGELDEFSRICVAYHNLLQPKYSFDKYFDVHRTTPTRQIRNNLGTDEGYKKYLNFAFESFKQSDSYLIYKGLQDGVWSTFDSQLSMLPYLERPDIDTGETSHIIKKEVEKTQEPFFLFTNYLEAHSPIQVNRYLDPELYSASEFWDEGSYEVWEMQDNPELDEDYTTNYRELYGASIEYLDRKLSRLIDHIQSTTERETTVLVTADHGHNLGYPNEDHLFSHGCSMSEGVLHIPLIMINPPTGFPNEVTEHFSHLDLGELIVRLSHGDSHIDDIVGGTIASEHEGFGSPQSKFEKFPGTQEEWEYWNRSIRVIYEDETKFEWDTAGGEKKYHITSDNPCRQELIETNITIPDTADEFFDIDMAEYKKKIDSMKISADVKEDLADLGYL
ncbi:sulfatase-like hydrolase/transferase [Halohasta litorea]|uniref:Sulfatase-like hydrolase/transferase n=1 Tax=Halohasta litorea TaxID=869891 RepID=A0ABD6D4G6_9EURY|nr:sulfatase-like hydrolase/transferase [Halohasta litorea]